MKLSGLKTHLLDHWQDPGFGIVVSVSSNAQVDLLLEVVFSVRSHEPEERVFGRLRDNVRMEHGGIIALHMAFDVGESREGFRSFLCCRRVAHIGGQT